ncbi:hypothetical protein J5N97_011792 [Dioscorea zingiberensis]|uniref:Uncharacterized protein n=1 Tax=Dioscorea zingiberensis TaxID=325984 RepID=A0A9D5HPW9_9LILI|nr:hypothetical protein J5N97_011792 [Dioscorea zingiberensis]
MTNVSNPVAQLLNTGNLVVRDADADDGISYAWQGFDYPTDTMLAGMKVGVDFVTGLNRTSTAWTSDSDPSPSPYYHMIEVRGDPEMVLCEQSKKVWRSGPWNGLRFSGIPATLTFTGFNFSFINNEQEITYSFNTISSVLSKLTVNQSGALQRSLWAEDIGMWNVIWYVPMDQCDDMRGRPCGSFAACNPNNSPICDCIQGFTPKSPSKLTNPVHTKPSRGGHGGLSGNRGLNPRDDNTPNPEASYLGDDLALVVIPHQKSPAAIQINGNPSPDLRGNSKLPLLPVESMQVEVTDNLPLQTSGAPLLAEMYGDPAPPIRLPVAHLVTSRNKDSAKYGPGSSRDPDFPTDAHDCLVVRVSQALGPPVQEQQREDQEMVDELQQDDGSGLEPFDDDLPLAHVQKFAKLDKLARKGKIYSKDGRAPNP